MTTLGTASLGPTHLTAHAHVVPGPLLKGIDSPKESLHALGKGTVDCPPEFMKGTVPISSAVDPTKCYSCVHCSPSV